MNKLNIVPGQLTLALTGGDLDAAIARFEAADVHLEVLR